jgi:pimeloyl-ACP methyl ester carboxylesterase
VLVHGSAADASTWTMQFQELSKRARIIAYDRAPAATVEAAADELEGVILHTAGNRPVVACGSSFGGVIVLDLARRKPYLFRSVVLCEPPLPCADLVTPVPARFACRFDALTALVNGEAAADSFLREVLLDAYDRVPEAVRKRARTRHREIRADSRALLHYRPRYAELASFGPLAVLVHGDRSRPEFQTTIFALADTLPRHRVVCFENAGHVMHVDAPRPFNRLLGELLTAP